MRISDWSSDVCSSDLARQDDAEHRPHESLKKREEARDGVLRRHIIARIENDERADAEDKLGEEPGETIEPKGEVEPEHRQPGQFESHDIAAFDKRIIGRDDPGADERYQSSQRRGQIARSEEHTSE